MSFTKQVQINQRVNLPLFDEGLTGYGVAPVVFKDTIYIFWTATVQTNSPENWFKSAMYNFSTDGITWPKGPWIPQSYRERQSLSIAPGTTPCPVVFNDELYVFYQGFGNDGTWYTKTTDGIYWTPFVSMRSLLSTNDMTFAAGTSPTATVCNGVLFLFWVNASSDITWAKFDGKNWGWIYPIFTSGVSIAKSTSAAAVTSGQWIYVFYQSSGNDGTYVFGFNPVTDIWGQIQKLQNGFYPGTSPAPWTSTDGSRVACAWIGWGGDNMWFTPWPVKPQRHVPVGSVYCTGGPVIGRVYTNCGAVSFKGISYLFWWGSGEYGIYYATAPDNLP